MLATFPCLSVKWVVCVRSQCQSCADRQDNPVTLADDLSLPPPIHQIRGVRRCDLFDWYYFSLGCEENSIYKVATNCLWEVSQYGGCQTIISTEGPLLGQGNVVSQVSAEIWLSLLKSPRVTMMSLRIICVKDKKVLQFMTTIITSMVQDSKSLKGEGGGGLG